MSHFTSRPSICAQLPRSYAPFEICTENRLAMPSMVASPIAMSHSSPLPSPEIAEQAGSLAVEQQLQPQPAANPVVEPVTQFVEVDVVRLDLLVLVVVLVRVRGRGGGRAGRSAGPGGRRRGGGRRVRPGQLREVHPERAADEIGDVPGDRRAEVVPAPDRRGRGGPAGAGTGSGAAAVDLPPDPVFLVRRKLRQRVLAAGRTLLVQQ